MGTKLSGNQFRSITGKKQASPMQTAKILLVCEIPFAFGLSQIPEPIGFLLKLDHHDS